MFSKPWSKGVCLRLCFVFCVLKSNNPWQVRAHRQAALNGENVAAACKLRPCRQLSRPLSHIAYSVILLNDTAFRGAYNEIFGACIARAHASLKWAYPQEFLALCLFDFLYFTVPHGNSAPDTPLLFSVFCVCVFYLFFS